MSGAELEFIPEPNPFPDLAVSLSLMDDFLQLYVFSYMPLHGNRRWHSPKVAHKHVSRAHPHTTQEQGT